MNIFQLVFKQMRQRALSTWLTTLSILLGVALGVVILILRNNSGAMFGQTSFGYDAIVGAHGSQYQLVFNSVYHIDTSPGNIPFDAYVAMGRNPAEAGAEMAEALATTGPASNSTTHPAELKHALPGYADFVKNAVPFCVGDTYNGKYRIVGTLATFFGYFDDPTNPTDPRTMQPLAPEHVMGYSRSGDTIQRFAIEPGGRCFNPNAFDAADQSFEAIIGSAVAASGDLKLGSVFQATHGELPPGANPDVHMTKWKVVGVLAPTHTANDRCVFIPLRTFYTVEEHTAGLIDQMYTSLGLQPPAADDPDKMPTYFADNKGGWTLVIPPELWRLSGIYVQSRGGATLEELNYNINRDSTAQYMCVKPAGVMAEFFATFLKGSTLILLLMSGLVTITAAVSVMTTIYNSVSARIREIAIVRALGATRGRVLALVCIEAGLVGVMGAVLGTALALAVSYGIGIYVLQSLGQPMNFAALGAEGVWYIIGVVVLSVVAGLAPGLKAYRTSVAANLVVV